MELPSIVLMGSKDRDEDLERDRALGLGKELELQLVGVHGFAQAGMTGAGGCAPIPAPRRV
jgi:hypothetical protein